MLRRVSSDAVSPPLGLYSHAIEIPAGARLLHIAGQVGVNASGVMEPDFESQFIQMWENVRALLAAAGMAFDDLVNVNTYLLGEEDLAPFRNLRTRFLPDPPPASTVLIVKALAKSDWLVEMDALAAKVD